MDKKVISIVLGGGRGSRLFPLTRWRSKPAVPIAAKYRLVDIPISNCLNSGLNKIMVLTQFNSASLNAHIKNTFNFDVFSKGFVDIIAADQNLDNSEWFQGTADAVRKSMVHLSKFDYDYILILSGDQLYQMDFQEMLDFHIQNQGDITIATIPVDDKDAPGFGILKANEHDEITAFIEKPQKEVLPDWVSDTSEESKAQGKNYLASMGIYIFTKSKLAKLFEENCGDDFGKEIIPTAIGRYKTLSYEFNGYWTDIGTIESFFKANMDLTKTVPQFNMFSASPIYTRARMLPPTKINGSYMEHVVVGDGAIISAERLEECVIGNRSRIGPGTVMKRTFMMGSDFYQNRDDFREIPENLFGVGENCYIENAIIDKNVMIGDEVIIKGGKHLEDGDYENYSVREGIVVVHRDAMIANGTKIEKQQ